METFGQTFVEFKNGVVDFGPFSLGTVTIEGMGTKRYDNFIQARKALAAKWNAEMKEGHDGWTEKDVEQWENDNKLTIHECSDMKTCQFVPTEIHEAVHHSGGVYECKIRDGNKERFDG